MQVDMIHAGISAAYLSLWIVIANIAVRRGEGSSDRDPQAQQPIEF